MKFKLDENLPLEAAEILIPVLLREPLERRLWIVEEERIRVRD